MIYHDQVAVVVAAAIHSVTTDPDAQRQAAARAAIEFAVIVPDADASAFVERVLARCRFLRLNRF